MLLWCPWSFDKFSDDFFDDFFLTNFLTKFSINLGFSPGLIKGPTIIKFWKSFKIFKLAVRLLGERSFWEQRLTRHKWDDLWNYVKLVTLVSLKFWQIFWQMFWRIFFDNFFYKFSWPYVFPWRSSLYRLLICLIVKEFWTQMQITPENPI